VSSVDFQRQEDGESISGEYPIEEAVEIASIASRLTPPRWVGLLHISFWRKALIIGRVPGDLVRSTM
jgi:hypothetical protein